MLNSLKSRVLVVLVVWLALSHIGSLWLYARKHEEAATLLQDALIADRIAFATKLLDEAEPNARHRMIAALSSPLIKVTASTTSPATSPIVEGTRPHLFEHLVGLFLDRPDHTGIKTMHTFAGRGQNHPSLLQTLSATLNPEPHHLPAGTLEEILTIGSVATEIALSDDMRITFTTPLLTVSPFSLLKLWGPLAAMLASVLLSAGWMISRATRPLKHLADAAERLGTDIRSAPLPESGAYEVRAAARAFNLMQDRVQRLVEDRTAFAAALAHDIGTPITRLVLRLDDMDESDLKVRMASDIDQMRRMVRSTLDFARMDFEAEPPECFDLGALMQSIADDMTDSGGAVTFTGPAHLTVMSRPVVLRRAIVNIADNAIKYGKVARISIDSPTAMLLRIVVDDAGPGVPASLHEEAFRPFRRLSDADGIAGTGLGLSVARSVARSLGGDVGLANRPEGGLRVALTLPRR